MSRAVRKFLVGFISLSVIIVFTLGSVAAIADRSTASILSKKTRSVNASASGVTTSKKTIIVDAGHGGVDGGAVSDGVIEKYLNFAIANFLAEDLRALGYEVITTRSEDVMLDDEGEGTNKLRDLRSRLQLTIDHPDSLFVSIHMNKFPTATPHGLQVFYSKNNPESKVLAETVRKMNRATLEPTNLREVKAGTSAIFLLDRIQTPAVLVECGFISNPSDRAKLTGEAYQKKMAAMIAAAIIGYCG